MGIGNLLLAFLDPGIGTGFLRALAVILNLALITGGITLFAYMCRFMRKKESEPLDQPRKRPSAACYATAISVTITLIVLSIFATLDQSQGTLASGSYSLSDLARFFIAILDPLLDIHHLANSPVKELFGLNLIVRVVIIYILIAALQIAIRQSGKIAIHFNIFLKEKLLTALPDEIALSKAADGEKGAKDELQLLVGRITKFFISSGSAVFAAFILGSDDMRQKISEVLTIIGDILNMITLMSNVTPASGFFSNALYTLLSIVMLAIYTTSALLLIIFIHTILKSWSQIKNWIINKAKTMRTGLAAALLAIIALAVVIGAGVCLQKYPSLQLKFANGLTEVLHIVANYAVLILVIVVILMLLVFAVSFLALLISFAWQTRKQKHQEWAEGFKGDKYWKIAKAAACVILAGILLVVAALCYDKLRDWLMGIFNPGEGIFSPSQVFKHAAIFAALLEGLFLLISTAAVLGFIIFWGFVDFFLKTRKIVISIASKLVKETLTTLLNILLLAPFFFSQVLLVIKSVVKTVLKIFIGYRTESEKNDAVFMAACFASLASLLNTFFGLYQFYGGGEQISGYSGWIRTICTFAIACAAQLAMLIFGMKAGEGLAEWRITNGNYAKDKLVRLIAHIILVVGSIATSGCLYTVLNDIFQNDITAMSLKDLIKYIPWLVALLVFFALYFWLRKKYRKSLPASNQLRDTFDLTENTSPQSGLTRTKKCRRLPFYWYLLVYLLLMIVSTGFAYSNLFGYYAHGAKVHERIYAQVRYEADHQLQLNERVAQVTDEYAQKTRELGDLFSARASMAVQVRDDKLAELRKQAEKEPSGEYEKSNRRDRFIGETNDFEQVISNIQSFLTSQYDDIGSNAAIVIEEYAHYWAVNPQPSYQTTCIMICLNGLQDIAHNTQDAGLQNDEDNAQGEDPPRSGGGDQNDGPQSSEGSNQNSESQNSGIIIQNNGNVIIIGTLVADKTLSGFGNENDIHVDARGKGLPSGRIVDPSSKSYSIAKTTRYVLNADKYDILKELFNQYERMENCIYNFDVPAEETTDNSESEQQAESSNVNLDFNTIPEETISAVFYSILDRNAQLDGIRANIAAMYRNSTNSQDIPSDLQASSNQVIEAVSMFELPKVAEAYLNDGNSNNSNTDSGGLPQAGNDTDEKTALPEYEKLSDYIDRALAVNSILQCFDTSANDGLNEGADNGTDWDDAVYKTQQYRNYARGIAHLEFQISYDALFRGHLNMNPVRDDINELYTTSAISIFLLVICLLIDLLAFFSGLLLFKSIYLFGKNSGILQMGYLNYEIALSYLFTLPRDSRCRVLHLAFMYKVLYGDASASAELEDSDIGDLQSNSDKPDINMSESEGNVPETSSESDNAANTAPKQESESTGSPDIESSAAPDQSASDKQASAEDSMAAPNESASETNSYAIPDESDKADAPDSESTTPDADSAEENTLHQQDKLNSTKQAEEGSQPSRIKKYFQDMDYLHRIMRSEDYRNLDTKMRDTLQALGVTEFDSLDAEQDDSYAFLQLWLRNFVEENGITFDELFPPNDDD